MSQNSTIVFLLFIKYLSYMKSKIQILEAVKLILFVCIQIYCIQ